MGNQLTLEWQDKDGIKTQIIKEGGGNKYQGAVRLGRNPQQCDIVVNHETVSRLHIEIYFDSEKQQFWLQNLQPTNPPLVNQELLSGRGVVLFVGSEIMLGEVLLKVIDVSLDYSIAATVLVRPPLSQTQSKTPVILANPVMNNYGLQCPSCQRISPYERIDLGCPWCGISLAAAVSVCIPPG